jgi:hypothetical protein
VVVDEWGLSSRRVDKVWGLKKGERVRFAVSRATAPHPSVPLCGTGVVLRKLGRAETCDSEVAVEGHGALCFYRLELNRWTP